MRSGSPTPSSPEGAHPLVETLRQLWPDAVDVSVHHDRLIDRIHPTRRSDGSPGRHLLAVPNARSPRLLVPAGRRDAAAGAMRRFSASLSRRATAERLAAAAALRLGGEIALADRFTVHTDGRDPFGDHLDELFDQPVTFSVGVGSARVNRKPILQVFDRHGRSLAFVKIGTGAESHADVRSEAAALQRLAPMTWTSLEVPAVIHEGDWRDLYILAITPFTTRARQPRGNGPPVAAMTELAQAFEGPRQRLVDTDWWRRISDRSVEIVDPGRRRRYDAAAARLVERAGDRRWQTGAWHGDWTSWNMAWGPSGVQVWDWERFETGVPHGLDRLHYVVNDHVVDAAGKFDTAIDLGLRAAGMQPDDDTGVDAAVYLLTMAHRYLPAIDRDGGHLIEARAMATLDVLERWMA